jgi:hypothetical protein
MLRRRQLCRYAGANQENSSGASWKGFARSDGRADRSCDRNPQNRVRPPFSEPNTWCGLVGSATITHQPRGSHHRPRWLASQPALEPERCQEYEAEAHRPIGVGVAHLDNLAGQHQSEQRPQGRPSLGQGKR